MVGSSISRGNSGPGGLACLAGYGSDSASLCNTGKQSHSRKSVDGPCVQAPDAQEVTGVEAPSIQEPGQLPQEPQLAAQTVGAEAGPKRLASKPTTITLKIAGASYTAQLHKKAPETVKAMKQSLHPADSAAVMTTSNPLIQQALANAASAQLPPAKTGEPPQIPLLSFQPPSAPATLQGLSNQPAKGPAESLQGHTDVAVGNETVETPAKDPAQQSGAKEPKPPEPPQPPGDTNDKQVPSPDPARAQPPVKKTPKKGRRKSELQTLLEDSVFPSLKATPTKRQKTDALGPQAAAKHAPKPPEHEAAQAPPVLAPQPPGNLQPTQASQSPDQQAEAPAPHAPQLCIDQGAQAVADQAPQPPDQQQAKLRIDQAPPGFDENEAQAVAVQAPLQPSEQQVTADQVPQLPEINQGSAKTRSGDKRVFAKAPQRIVVQAAVQEQRMSPPKIQGSKPGRSKEKKSKQPRQKKTFHQQALAGQSKTPSKPSKAGVSKKTPARAATSRTPPRKTPVRVQAISTEQISAGAQKVASSAEQAVKDQARPSSPKKPSSPARPPEAGHEHVTAETNPAGPAPPQPTAVLAATQSEPAIAQPRGKPSSGAATHDELIHSQPASKLASKAATRSGPSSAQPTRLPSLRPTTQSQSVHSQPASRPGSRAAKQSGPVNVQPTGTSAPMETAHTGAATALMTAPAPPQQVQAPVAQLSTAQLLNLALPKAGQGPPDFAAMLPDSFEWDEYAKARFSDLLYQVWQANRAVRQASKLENQEQKHFAEEKQNDEKQFDCEMSTSQDQIQSIASEAAKLLEQAQVLEKDNHALEAELKEIESARLVRRLKAMQNYLVLVQALDMDIATPQAEQEAPVQLEGAGDALALTWHPHE